MAAVLEKTGSLDRLRHVLKESLVWLPLVGAFLTNHGSFFINRSMLNWRRFDKNAYELATSETPVGSNYHRNYSLRSYRRQGIYNHWKCIFTNIRVWQFFGSATQIF